MSRWITWQTVSATVMGLVAMFLFGGMSSRRQRQAAPRVTGTRTYQWIREPVAPGRPAAFPSPQRASSDVALRHTNHSLDRNARRDARLECAREDRGRRLPRVAFAGALAAAALPAALFASHFMRSTVSGPALAAEAVDTEQGVYMLVQGHGFRPNSTVAVYWHHPDDDTVRVTSSADGKIVTLAPLPGTDHTLNDGSGTMDLVANDGTSQVALPFTDYGAPVSPGAATSVLGVTSTSRVLVNGSPYFLLGANYPWINYGNDFGSNAWGSYGVHTSATVASDFADMKAKGVHVVRWWVFADGRAGINFASDGTPLGVQPVVYDDLNKAVAVARQNNIYLDLVLFDVSLLSKGQTSGGVQMGGRTDLLSDATKRSALINNVITPLVKTYASEPAILSWELMNEPEWGISDLPQPAVNSNYNPVTMQQFWSYASAASSIIHLYSPQQVTVGSAALKWNRVWTDAFAAGRGLPQMHLDFYQTHYYQWMDCCSTNDATLGQTTWSPLTQQVSLLGLDKPIVVGEIHTPSGSAGTMLDQILGNGYAGFWGWSYNYAATGDKLQIDWSTYTPWEAAHASIVDIAPAPAPTSTATPQATVVPATPTPQPSTPAATNTSAATATKTATAPATPTMTATSATATATKTATATPTNTAVPTATSGSGQAVQFGYTSSQGVNDDSDSGYINGTNVNLGVAGTLQSLSVYVGGTSPGAHVRLALYATDSTGRPSSLVAETASQTAAMGWNTLPVTQPTSLQPGAYWVVAQTDDRGTVYRIASGQPATSYVGWTSQKYGPFPSNVTSWHRMPNWSFSMYGTVATDGAPVAATPQTDATPSATPTSAPASATPSPSSTPAAPTNTATPTPAPSLTSTAVSVPTPTAIPTVTGGCVSNCGDPRYFCDTWSGGFCDDFREKTSGATQLPFPAAGDPYSFECFSATNTASIPYQPYYVPTMNQQNVAEGLVSSALPFPCGFSANEHFMTRMEDGQFGMAVLRLQQPMDFAGREAHVHFDVDLKTSARRYVRFMLSPQLTEAIVDDRHQDVRTPANEFALWFVNGRFIGTVTRNDVATEAFAPYTTYYGTDNVRDHVDVYISRTHVRVVVDGTQYINTDVPDMGFDRAYMYLAQVSYNPCKDGECDNDLQMFHWDNVAFDGPALPLNGLTPAGSQDVMFNVYSATSCSAAGVPAQPVGDVMSYHWQTWVARMPAGTPVSPSDVTCSGGEGFNLWDRVARGFQVVHQ